jgi:hypothetical protein
MNSKMVSVIFLILFLTLCLGCVIPYPNFNNSSINSKGDQQIINDKYEDEILNTEADFFDVEVLCYDWFEFMNNHFTKYVTCRVIDIYSGKSYYVQRLGGYNHADVQTIDAKNTTSVGTKWIPSKLTIW